MTDDPFELTPAEKATPLWQRLKLHYQDCLQQARVSNDNAKLTEQESAALRGQIKCLKRMIALDEDKPLVGFGDGA